MSRTLRGITNAWSPSGAQDRRSRMRLGLFCLTLLAAAYIGLRPASRLALLLVLAVSAALGLLWLLRCLPWGLIALVPLSFLVDLHLDTGTNVSLNATFLFLALLLGVWLLRMLVVDRKLRLSPNLANLPALLFIGAGVLAWLTSLLPWLPLASSKPTFFAQLGAYLLYALSIGGFLLAANLLASLRLVKIFTWTYLSFAVIYLLVSLVSPDYTMLYTWLVDAHYGQSVFWTLLVTLSAGQGLFNADLKWPLRAGLLGVALLTLAYLLVYRPGWISGWLPVLIALGSLVWLRDWRSGLLATLVAGLAALLFLPVVQDFLATQVNDPVQQWSTYSRFATWPVVFELFKASPLTGLGPANYAYYTSLYPLAGYFVQFNTHNNYFDILLQYGLVGLLLFSWLAIAILRTAWVLRRSAGDGFSRAYANALLAGLVAVLISGTFADWFLPFIYNIGVNGSQASIYLWLFAGGLMSIASLWQQAGSIV